MAPKHSWQVTSVVGDQVIPTQAGQTITGSYVYFLTGDGNEGSVFVPNAIFNHDTVERMVREAAIKLDRVASITGEANR